MFSSKTVIRLKPTSQSVTKSVQSVVHVPSEAIGASFSAKPEILHAGKHLGRKHPPRSKADPLIRTELIEKLHYMMNPFHGLQDPLNIRHRSRCDLWSLVGRLSHDRHSITRG
ncbi:hypothetical protein AWENTII_002055 [Aspergillus wentii]